ncbi:helix-turn-helix domain-containing protein [Hymenobacter sp. BT175]|uniref:helix-turn-helix transcriptional regulator n=1 Tax=Hymenobacter translucens TaxID=2886507 RepID=UPI001D0E1B38|nr:helix-turn-helix transcriptional regulator [Hymenobacter translucens]MCC2548036.1 helix-turn-helix domain-containing protein [Hymenobacter translucens]
MPRSLRVPAVPHYLVLVRAGLGLTQEQLAGALGVSRGLITKVEAGQRTLPARAAHTLAWLAQALPPALPPSPFAPPTATPPLSADEQAVLQDRAGAVAYEIRQLTRRLERGQARTRRAQDWLRAVPALQATLPADEEGPRLWLAATTAEAEAALEGEGRPVLHRLLTARLTGLQAEAAALATALGGS